MPEVEINPGAPPQADLEATPLVDPNAAPAPDPAALAKELEDLRRQKAEVEQDKERLSQAYNTLAMSAMSMGNRSPVAPAEPEVKIPDREEDPDGYVQAMIHKGVTEAIRREVTPIVEQYRNDRTSQFSSAVETQRFMMRSDKNAYPNFEEFEKDVMKYASQFPAEQLAKPGALAECYTRIAGAKYIELQQKERLRSQASIETGGRGSSSDPSPTRERLTDREVQFARRSEMNDKQFRALQGAGHMSIDDWDALEAKKGA